MRSEKTNKLLWEADALEVELISGEEAKKYPDERIIDIDGFRNLIEDKTDEEIKITLLAKQTLHLKTIKNIVIFFLVMWLIGVTVGLVYIVKLASGLNAIL